MQPIFHHEHEALEHARIHYGERLRMIKVHHDIVAEILGDGSDPEGMNARASAAVLAGSIHGEGQGVLGNLIDFIIAHPKLAKLIVTLILGML
jgi:hypothetical protein